MAKTDNHEWPTPNEGDANYEETFKQFFNQVDNDVEIRDTDANKSNYDPKTGAKYVATDTQKVYLGDGSSWVHVPTSGENPSYDVVTSNVTKHATTIDENYTVESGEGTVLAGPITGSGSISGSGQLAVVQEGTQFTDNVDAQGNNISNVGTLDTERLVTRSRDADVVVWKADDGTVYVDGGDDTIHSGTDFETAISEAFNALTSGRDHKEVVSITGEFEVSSSIDPPSWTILNLEGSEITIADGSNAVIFAPSGREKLDIIGGTLDGNGSNQTGGSIFAGGITDGHIINVTSRDCYRDHYITSGGGSGSENLTFIGCVADGAASDDGFNPLNSSDITFHGCVAKNMENDGFHISNDAQNVSCHGCIAKSNGRDGFHVRNDGVELHNPISIENQGIGIRAFEGAEVAIYGGEIDGGATPVTTAGITAPGTPSNQSRVRVYGTDIYNVENQGINLEEAPDSIVRDVLVDGAGSLESVKIKANCHNTKLIDVIERNGPGEFVDIETPNEDIEIVRPTFGGSVNDRGATRTRWDGLIGGGPLGGVDVGSTTGASEGDRARSDGTNASASADELFILKSGGDWQSIADPSTTITPS